MRPTRKHPKAGTADDSGADARPGPLPFPAPMEAGPGRAFQAPIYHASQWLSLPEAAAYTGLPQTILRKLMSSGKLRGLDTGPRIGGRWRIKRSDLDAISAD